MREGKGGEEGERKVGRRREGRGRERRAVERRGGGKAEDGRKGKERTTLRPCRKFLATPLLCT